MANKRSASHCPAPEDPGIATLLEKLRSLTVLRLLVGPWSAAAVLLAFLGFVAFMVTLGPTGPETSRIRIQEGDSLARLFARAGLPDRELLAVMEAQQGAAFRLDLVPGEEVRIVRREDGTLEQLFVGTGGGQAVVFIAGDGNHFNVASPRPVAEPTPASPTVVASRSGPNVENREALGSTVGAPLSSEIAASGKAETPGAATSPTRPVAQSDAPAPREAMERVAVRNGDSLYLIFNRVGLSQTDLQHLLLAAGGDGKNLKRLRPGQSVEFLRGPDGRLSRFHHEVDELTTLEFTRNGDGFTSRVAKRDYHRHVAVKNGVIKSSLFAAADGVPDQVVHQFVDVLEWDIDFARDLRKGDSFSLLYEELHIDGRRVRTGDVLALEFRSERAGKPIRAFRYTDSDGETDYFTPDGRSLRRAFMRNPLRFTRISSRFSKSRLHPVLRVHRPHRGVDYAAPRGTPVRATGSGRVSFAGRKGGYGKTVVLTHGNGYTTLYGHLSRYAKGVRRGKGVQQGQVIGYVGTTGISTGPHLHYEFRINGVHRDPLKVALPRAAPLDGEEMKRFQRAIGPLLARIDTLGATQLASLDRQ